MTPARIQADLIIAQVDLAVLLPARQNAPSANLLTISGRVVRPCRPPRAETGPPQAAFLTGGSIAGLTLSRVRTCASSA
jgi:hypothetical protein